MFLKQDQVDLTKVLLDKGPSHPPASDGSADVVVASLILDCHNTLGEGIVYDDRTSTILWTDILEAQFHTLQLNVQEPAKGVHTVYALPKKLGSFGMLDLQQGQDVAGAELPLLCAWEDGFQLYDVINGKELSTMSVGEDVNPIKQTTRLNDGRVDRTGMRFCCKNFPRSNTTSPELRDAYLPTMENDSY